MFVPKGGIRLALAIVPMLFMATSASAYESPVQNLVDFSKKKLTEVKKITIENQAIIQKDQPSQGTDKAGKKEEKKERKRVPEGVSDPKKIEEAVEFASNATGVRKDFIMGMLVVESNLGRNPGECTYEEVEKGAEESHLNGQLSARAWETFKNRREVVKDIADGLGYDYEKLKVSCNPGAAYAGTGGALGIPQFMPDTWLEYKDRISQVTGKKNPDPWDVRDGTVAMALKLSDVYGVTSHSTLAERNAAKMYLSGTTSWQYDWYANKILYWAENYKKLLG